MPTNDEAIRYVRQRTEPRLASVYFSGMDLIRVYRFELFDAESRSFVRQARYATEKAIIDLRGVVMYSTAKDAPESEIGGDGMWPASAALPKREGETI